MITTILSVIDYDYNYVRCYHDYNHDYLQRDELYMKNK